MGGLDMGRVGYGGRLPVDPKMVREIQGNPSMRAEQGVEFMSDWGGPNTYVQAAVLPRDERVVYYAIREGLTTPEQIAPAVDMDVKDVQSALSWLEKKGLIVSEAPV